MRSPDDARAVVHAGADAIGLNFVPHSPRRLCLDEALVVARAAREAGPVELVGLFVDAEPLAIEALDACLDFARVQLHGDEPPEVCARFGPRALKALRVGTESDLAAADAYVEAGVRWLLLDALAPGARGGTGRVIDWGLLPRLRARLAGTDTRLVLAGGLTPTNLGDAILAARPDGVDAASGVERAPGIKDAELVRRFVAEARRAAAQVWRDGAPLC